MVLAAVVLCGCTASIGFDRGASVGEIAGSPDLRVVAGHFESAGGFGLGAPAGAVGKIIEADGARLRIDAVLPDPKDRSGEIVYYRFSRLAADGTATPYCAGDSHGLGFPMAGVWTKGVHAHAPGRIAIACLGSAEARCVALGYRPWHTGPHGANLWDYHEACVHALRADYCGTGQSHAATNQTIALYDRIGVQPLRAADGMSFEAAWGPYGAACVNHSRSPGRMTLRDLRIECPNLPKTRLGNSCDERDPALIFTKSPLSPAS